jgi:hypothetical protein
MHQHKNTHTHTVTHAQSHEAGVRSINLSSLSVCRRFAEALLLPLWIVFALSLPSEATTQRPREGTQPSMGCLGAQEQDFGVLLNGLHRELSEYVDMKFDSTSDALMERFSWLCDSSLSELENDCVTSYNWSMTRMLNAELDRLELRQWINKRDLGLRVTELGAVARGEFTPTLFQIGKALKMLDHRTHTHKQWHRLVHRWDSLKTGKRIQRLLAKLALELALEARTRAHPSQDALTDGEVLEWALELVPVWMAHPTAPLLPTSPVAPLLSTSPDTNMHPTPSAAVYETHHGDRFSALMTQLRVEMGVLPWNGTIASSILGGATTWSPHKSADEPAELDNCLHAIAVETGSDSDAESWMCLDQYVSPMADTLFNSSSVPFPGHQVLYAPPCQIPSRVSPPS